MSLDFMERLAVRFLMKVKLADLHTNAFEEFFHELMCYRYPSFLDVRTAGSLGDEGSDGLLLHGNKLYACYAPEVFSTRKLIKKFEDDFAKALRKRKGQFDTFVFVHSDQRGMHPTVTKCLADARNKNNDLKFEQFGQKHFRNEACRLDLDEVEDLLGTELPAKEMTYSFPLEELEPLLDHLRLQRVSADTSSDLGKVSLKKLDFNKFSEDTKYELRRMMVRSSDIEEYYANRIDITERDEVAAGFHEEYLRLCTTFDDPDEIMWQLELYVLGNAAVPPHRRRAVTAVLAYFFQTCDIFENPPLGWESEHDLAREPA
ncbi:hypothetical protein FNH05_27370 [Amycolatopsis rhizosphaerae]|uniref:ABC-three component systems C-terminal domain-containing protein n=1 Tax=Amycolatopsis rhizosphaerae TaxID=2053003 RepID=A0A558B994_9PSEU|nr:ABC-three component system protein [Amycolatopsis rhizosphaerae]TVT33086.1 hypothetical protein FNH05_27370 [Amycolatopsis rhizosphaerae]